MGDKSGIWTEDDEKESNLAQEKARRKAREKIQEQGIPDQAPTGLTSYEDLVKDYRTAIVSIPSGKAFEVRVLSPGDLVLSIGSPIMKALQAVGVDTAKIVESGDQTLAEQQIRNISVEDKVRIAGDEDVHYVAKQTICLCVISINFVMKPQSECHQERQEVSIDLLNMQDMFNLYTVIMQLSVAPEDVDVVQLFRGEDEKEQREHSEDTPDSTSIRDETVEAIVSSQE